MKNSPTNSGYEPAPLHGREALSTFLDALNFSGEIWLKASWDLPLELKPDWWQSYKDKEGNSHAKNYVFSGVASSNCHLALKLCEYGGKDAQGSTIWTPSETYFADGFDHVLWLSSIGTTVYFYPNQPNGGISNKHVSSSNLLFYEIDHLPIQDQWTQISQLTATTGLQPCAVVFTGGKSLHVYFSLSESVSAERWLLLNRKLTVLQDSDPAICNVARPMRLPGLVRRKAIDGQLTEPAQISLEQWSDATYTPDEFEAALDLTGKFPHGLSYERWRQWRNASLRRKEGKVADPDIVLIKPESELYPKSYKTEQDFRYNGDRIPLEICLTKDDRALIAGGAAQGTRDVSGCKLAKNLIGTADALDGMGIAYEPNPRQLLEEYANKCSPPLSAREVEKLWRSSGHGNPKASLSDEAIKNCIAAWQRKQNPQSSTRDLNWFETNSSNHKSGSDNDLKTNSGSDRAISESEWQTKFGFPEWFKYQIGRFSEAVRRFTKPPTLKLFRTANPKPDSQNTVGGRDLSWTWFYCPDGAREWLESHSDAEREKVGFITDRLDFLDLKKYPYLDAPTIQFPSGKRLEVISELVKLGYRYILDTSAPGTSKSHEAGLFDPDRFEVDRLWYFSADHRNPTTPTVEANFVDMPVRNDWMVSDPARRTPLNSPHVRWPKPGEKGNTQGNCFRAKDFHTLAAKGYREVNSEASINPICGNCHVAGACAGKKDSTPVPGATYRLERQEVFGSTNRIRASADSAPGQKDLEEDKNAAIWDEAMRQLKPTESVDAELSDFDQVFAEIESRLPEVYEQLRPMKLALRPILSGEVRVTQETYHGWSDAGLREILGDVPQNLEEIILKLDLIQPDLEEILRRPDSFTKDGVSKKDRKSVSNETSKFIRDTLRQEGYREVSETLRSLASNWLIPFLKVWGGFENGALRIRNHQLTITTRSSRHAEIAKAMEFNYFIDSTATRELLGLYLDIPAESIVQIEQISADYSNLDYSNLTIVRVTGFGLAGHDRSESFNQRKKAFKAGIAARHFGGKNAFVDHKEHAADDDGWWFSHTRGSNEFLDCDTLTTFGTPYENIGSLQDTYIALTGDHNIDQDAPGFSNFVRSQVQAEMAQATGRLRANLRPNKPLRHYSCCDFDLDFLANYYPGATIIEERAFAVAPEAGTRTEQSHYRIQQRIIDFVKTTGQALENLTQVVAAKAAGVSQGRISQIAVKFGGWRGYKQLLAVLLEGVYRPANNSPPLDQEQKFIATTYLPLAAEESPPDAVDAIATVFREYGWHGFRAILAATPIKTKGQLMVALISGLPRSLQEEFRLLTKEVPG